MSTNSRISNLISNQLPDFVKKDGQLFVEFMEAYYEFLEQSEPILSDGQVIERQKNLLNYIDIDKTLDDFAEKFYEEFLHFFPKTMSVDRKILIKNIQDYYRAKGTEKSLKFLLRIFSGQEATLYYPKVDILRASDGKWFIEKSLRITDIKIDNVSTSDPLAIKNFLNHKIVGMTSSATATIERTDRFREQGTLINELFITNTHGNFDDGEMISTIYTDLQGEEHSIEATIFGGILSSISITDGGSQYEIGDIVIIETANEGGAGANAVVSAVSGGNIETLLIVSGGAGFKANDQLLFTGGGGVGTNVFANTVNTDASIHPNSYNIIMDLIAYEANTQIGNAVYSNLVLANANTTLSNSFHTFTYGPTGPIDSLRVISLGSGYSSVPDIDVIANTRIQELGILGRMSIVNPGIGYAVGNIIEFRNTMGFGANATVTANNANGSITAVRFQANSGWVIGGVGYNPLNLPTTNVRTTTGSGANIAVVSTLGDGESFNITTGTLGVIERISITDRGSGYAAAPTVNLTQSGDGTATAIASIVAGVFTYPGRYLNDDGHISSYNFLQNRDYYQNFSYVVKVKKSLNEYKKLIKNLNHPAGLKLFGEYSSVNNVNSAYISSNNVSIPSWVFNTATVDIDFANNRSYMYYGRSGIANTFITTSRSSIGYADDIDGVWTSFSANTPRITDKGLLVEEARTNSIRNNSMQGAVAGSPGTLPINWGVSASNGLATNVIGFGTQSGIDYIDLEFTGTTSGTFYVLAFGGTVAASVGQVWTQSMFVALVGGSLANVSVVEIDTRFNAATADTAFSPTATMTRYSGVATVGVGTTTIQPAMALLFSSGVAIDLTLRIGWPQLELGSFVTSPIRTTSAAVSRSADVVTLTGPLTFGATGTVYVAFSPEFSTTSVYGRLISLNNGTTNNEINIEADGTLTGGFLSYVGNGGVEQASAFSGAIAAGSANKATLAYATNDFAFVLNSATVGTDVSGTVPTVTQINIGHEGGGGQTSSYIARIALFSSRLDDGRLRALTA